MSPYGTDVIMFHARNPCGRLGRKIHGPHPSPHLPPSPHVPSGGHDLHIICIEKNMKKHNANNTVRRRASRRLAIPRVLLSATDIQLGAEAASPGIAFDEAIFDYMGTAIIRHNYYYCKRMGNKSLGKASVTDTLLAHAGSKCSPKDHFHSNLIFS